MATQFVWFSRQVVAGVLCIACSTVAATAAPYLWWKIEPVGAAQRENGLTFDMFGAQSTLELLLTISNDDSDESLSLPHGFVPSLDLFVKKEGRSLEVDVEWLDAAIVVPAGTVAAAVGQPLTLQAGERLEIRAAVRPAAGAPEFDLGDYQVGLNIRRAAAGIRLLTGAVWTGRYEPEGAVSIRLIEPKTPQDHRRFRMTRGEQALSRSDPQEALRLFLEQIRMNPTDLEARAGAGRAYLDLGRYREAAAEFELVLPSLQGKRSALYLWLAHAYVGLGEEQKAEAMLRRQLAGDLVRAQMDRFREEVKKRRRDP